MKYMKEGKILEKGRPWLKRNLYRRTLIVASEVFLPANVPLAIDDHSQHPESSPTTSLSCLPEPLQSRLPNPRELPPNQIIFFFSFRTWLFGYIIEFLKRKKTKRRKEGSCCELVWTTNQHLKYHLCEYEFETPKVWL